MLFFFLLLFLCSLSWLLILMLGGKFFFVSVWILFLLCLLKFFLGVRFSVVVKFFFWFFKVFLMVGSVLL